VIITTADAERRRKVLSSAVEDASQVFTAIPPVRGSTGSESINRIVRTFKHLVREAHSALGPPATTIS